MSGLPQTQDVALESPVIDARVIPLTIHVGFDHGEHTDRTFGPVYFYSPLVSGTAQVIRVRTGSKVVFVNDDTSGIPHTASGFGPTSFPAQFDNKSGMRRAGTTINSSLTWSTGTLLHGQRSQTFTIGARGHYFFGCAFHYTTRPTAVNGSMGDVIVSM
ncbi:MAG: hypothetical protein JO322_10735 [Candidatus Eremiobacteraeota bacterium]|nr:hypothetical protein [Candidatus Eremiobacteraeota bacterium]